MLLTVEGTYLNGKVELAETPAGVQRAKVLVTFLSQEKTPVSARYLSHGQFAGERMSTEEDFSIAEWRGETKDQDDD